MFKEIKKLHKRGYKCIVGIDEAGRGPLAGPVVACAVFLKEIYGGPSSVNLARLNLERLNLTKLNFKNIKDSKKLSAKQRDKWYEILTGHPDLQWGVGIVSEKVIDKINILEATKSAMRRAVEKLKVQPDFLIIDGNFNINLFRHSERSVAQRRILLRSFGLRLQDDKAKGIEQKAIPKADEKIFLCAAASIIAKVTRDRIMQKMHKKYPQYGFGKHKGYGTKEHLRALRKYGACGIHRITFNPIATFLSAKKLRKKLRPATKFG